MDSNPRPFNHESGALATELSLLPKATGIYERRRGVASREHHRHNYNLGWASAARHKTRSVTKLPVEHKGNRGVSGSRGIDIVIKHSSVVLCCQFLTVSLCGLLRMRAAPCRLRFVHHLYFENLELFPTEIAFFSPDKISSRLHTWIKS